MPKVAITGHMDLTANTKELVRTAIRLALREHAATGPVTGVSCLAVGSDSIFAEEVLALGGDLLAVVPAEDYRERKVSAGHSQTFDQFLSRAASVETMPYLRSGRDAYHAANERLIELADILFAVWDGHEGVDKGGTAALVRRARTAHRRVEVIWPPGSERESQA
jgi:hypothetical protein